MLKRFRVHYSFFILFAAAAALALIGFNAFAAKSDAGTAGQDMIQKGMSLWELILAGGWVMVPLFFISIWSAASVTYHFQNITPEKLTPPEFSENLLYLLEKKEYDKAVSVCRQQPNMVAEIALKGLAKISKGKSVIEEAIQHEGKAKIEKLWQNLAYLGDAAVVAPMLGLLGTILGMIQAFNYQAFKAGIIKPVVLAQGLAKAMITTAAGLIIAVPVLVFYSYFRGRISRITSNAERVSAEILQTIAK